jgi:aspartate aminotransferase
MPWAGPDSMAPLTAGRAYVPVSATLAANERLAARRRRGQPVLPLAFGEAGLPVHPALRRALAEAAGRNAYGPVAGLPALREAAAGYFDRREMPTSPGSIVCGPGSKPLLFGLLLAIGADVAVPRPSWVSYAAQAGLIGARAHHVPTRRGDGGVCDPGQLERVIAEARAQGRRIGSVVVTLPDNPTGRLAASATMRALCAVAAEHDLIIISDEIYRDLIYDPTHAPPSPATIAPQRTVVTTALSKSLAVGGWRIGVARLPSGGSGAELRDRLTGIASEIWSAPPGPIQEAAAYAFAEPADITERIANSRRLHATVARAVARRCEAAGLVVPSPQAAFYVYPDFGPWREHLRARHRVSTGGQLAGHLLERYGAGVLPGSTFGEDERALRVRMATGLLYGDTEDQREAALDAVDPLTLPWIKATLARLEELLADLAPRRGPATTLAPSPQRQPAPRRAAAGAGARAAR